jgi:hypothetical protein
MSLWRSGRCLFAALVVVGLGLAASSVRAEADSLGLVRSGRTDYVICVDPEASAAIRSAADTLSRYIRKISSAELPVSTSSAKKGHRVVLEVGRSVDANLNVRCLGHNGFRIRTLDENIYITANSDYGLQNGVYTFLETFLGCRMYSPTVQFVPHCTSIVLPAIDDTEIPPITFRMLDYFEPTYSHWHKLNYRDQFGLFVHTFQLLVPPEKYFKTHPEYFELTNSGRVPNGQLCLSNPDVFRLVVEDLRTRMKANPNAQYWSVSQNDTWSSCQCAACRAIDSAEGSPSGAILAFVNRVADEFPDKVISTLAYQYSRSAPKYIKPRPNVNIMLCSIELNRSKPIAADPSSASFVKDVEDWGRLTHNIFLWDYVIQFRNLYSPFPNLRVLQPNLQFFSKNGITSVFEQGLTSMHGEFAELRTYLLAKLLWNPDINIDSVMNDFLQGYYGDAAPYLRQYIDTMHASLAASGEGLDIYGYPTSSSSGYLSPGMLDLYDSLFDRAEHAVADQPDFRWRVEVARLPLQFAFLEQAKVFGAADRGFFILRGDSLVINRRMESLLDTFVVRCKQEKIERLWEHGTSPDEYDRSTRNFLKGSVERHLALGRPVMLTIPASPKYHNGEASALTDGMRGWGDYHMHWLGFEGTDMDATVDLGSVQSVSQIGTEFLQDINSWVFMPLSVLFEVSEDGRQFRSVGQVTDLVPQNKDGAIVAPFNVTFTATRARYVRVRATNMKICPDWHKGAGGRAWIFIDEISVL